MLIPGITGQQKLEGTFDFIWSVPVPRSAQAASTFLLYTLLSLITSLPPAGPGEQGHTSTPGGTVLFGAKAARASLPVSVMTGRPA